MMAGRRSMAVSSGLAGVAVLAEVARFLAEQSGLQFISYRSFVAIAGPLVLTAIGAFYVKTVEGASIDSVVAGFLLGGLLYGTGLLGFHWYVNYRSITEVPSILPFHVVLTAGFVLMAALGAAGGHLVGYLRQEWPP